MLHCGLLFVAEMYLWANSQPDFPLSVATLRFNMRKPEFSVAVGGAT